MIWLTSPEMTATKLPAAWLIASGARPGNLTERSRLRQETGRQVIARQLGLSLDAVSIGHDADGRPSLAQPDGAGLHLSLATRSGLVAVALAPRAVGVDVERADTATEPPLSVLHPKEAAMLCALHEGERALAFARLWCAKEAYVKALGTGFARAPESFAVTLLSADRFEIADPVRAGVIEGASRTMKNGGQEILAAAMIVLD